MRHGDCARLCCGHMKRSGFSTEDHPYASTKSPAKPDDCTYFIRDGRIEHNNLSIYRKINLKTVLSKQCH